MPERVLQLKPKAHQEPQPRPLQPTKRVPKPPPTPPPSKLLRMSDDYMPPKQPDLEAIDEESRKQEATDEDTDEGHH